MASNPPSPEPPGEPANLQAVLDEVRRVVVQQAARKMWGAISVALEMKDGRIGVMRITFDETHKFGS